VALMRFRSASEAAWAKRRFGAVSLLFGKTAPGGDRVAQVAEIRMGYEAFEAFWQNTGEVSSFYDRFSSWASRTGPLDGGRPAVDTPAEELLSYSWFRATIALASHAGTDAEMSFFAIPVRSASDAIRDHSVTSVPLVGVLRVTMTGHELYRLLQDCKHIHSELAPLLAEARETNPQGLDRRVGGA
jgi:hypothetical protein